jgi:hypothetical protein
MPVKGIFSLNGLDDYLEKIAAAGIEVDEAVAQAMNESAPIVGDEMHRLLRASSETWTGATERTLFKTAAKREGNYTFVELGADTSRDPAGIYKEFGVPRQAAEPFIRPAFANMRTRWRNAMKKILTELGVA